jgi:hypothetical protein
MNLIFGYVALYDISRSVTKDCMILMCVFSVMNYVSFMLVYRLMLFIDPFNDLFCNHMCTLGFCLVE